ncbi:MAG: hypothetical protein PVI35_07215 [Acidimicrobiia bacterium]|jgi:hypothetical protein
MSEVVLTGHFWTRGEAARRAVMSTHELQIHPGLIRLGGTWLEEVYCAFQFDEHGVRDDIASVVEILARRLDPAAVADWIVRPNPDLATLSPLNWLNGGRSPEAVRKVARAVAGGESSSAG